MRAVSSWGRLGAPMHDLVILTEPKQVSRLITHRDKPGLAHGMGRSYGDVCLNPQGMLWQTTALDHFVAFDEESGRLICEAGVLLRDIQRLVIPRGWILPVTPGTQLVTVGGAIANDVHGKNHHVHGSFGDHVLGMTLLRTDGTAIECGPSLHADWFAATIGGMGLTGVIVTAEIQLRRVASPWLSAETVPYDNFHDFFRLADGSEEAWEHTVSWIDCLRGAGGRGLFMRANAIDGGERKEPKSRRRTMPIVPPISLVNGLSLRPFNTAYFHLKKLRAGTEVVHYESFFYPLDNLLEWNRMYGPKGFFQYQCVVPREVGHDAVKAMLSEIGRSGSGSFLAVLKTFGNRLPVGLMSFPMPGVTLALDFPNNGDTTTALFLRLDAIVRQAGGRIYPAKDARMPRDLFEAGYPNLHTFLKYRDPGISSGLSRRLMGS